mmetsp:Transcript_15643/g.43237  ORF Transcript_15643/g.43237 Transcript_15643/m.43237 type:complete len:333 (-) Transcript_15643:12-1010(-)
MLHAKVPCGCWRKAASSSSGENWTSSLRSPSTEWTKANGASSSGERSSGTSTKRALPLAHRRRCQVLLVLRCPVILCPDTRLPATLRRDIRAIRRRAPTLPRATRRQLATQRTQPRATLRPGAAIHRRTVAAIRRRHTAATTEVGRHRRARRHCPRRGCRARHRGGRRRCRRHRRTTTRSRPVSTPTPTASTHGGQRRDSRSLGAARTTTAEVGPLRKESAETRMHSRHPPTTTAAGPRRAALRHREAAAEATTRSRLRALHRPAPTLRALHRPAVALPGAAVTRTAVHLHRRGAIRGMATMLGMLRIECLVLGISMRLLTHVYEICFEVKS